VTFLCIQRCTLLTNNFRSYNCYFKFITNNCFLQRVFIHYMYKEPKKSGEWYLGYHESVTDFHDLLFKDHNLKIIGKPMMQSYLPKRLIREAYFTCEQSKEWISSLAQCDNNIDCLDASDEVNCSHYKIGMLSFEFTLFH
jgi:hypothetical protein